VIACLTAYSRTGQDSFIGPAVPRGKEVTVSFVDVHPSTDKALKLSSTAAASER